MRKENTALERLTHSFPRNKITSPITLTRPIRRMLFIINSVAIAEALKKPLPVIAICRRQADKPTKVKLKLKTKQKCKRLGFPFSLI